MDGFVGQRELRSLARRRTWLHFRCALTTKHSPPHPHRLGNVLEGLRPEVIAGNFDLAPDLPIGVIRYANSAWLGNALQPRGDIDAITENIVVVDDNVADMDADAKFDPLILRQGGILLGHPALDFQ